MIFGMGPVELGLIVIIVLVIFGPKNLPKLGKSLGKTVKGIREGMEDTDDAKPESKQAEDVIVDHDPQDDDAPVESDGSFCPQCGAKNPAENHFCSKCGAKLSE